MSEYEAVPAPTRRVVTLSVSMVATAALVAAAGLVTAPYVVQGPGPTFDVLGEDQGVALIDVADPQAASGELLLTTVTVAGSPTRPLPMGQVLAGWLSGTKQVLPVDRVFDSGRTQDQIDEQNAAAMISSQEYAVVAALEELGHEVPTTLRVAETVPGGGADGVVLPDDVLIAVDGSEPAAFSDLAEILAAIAPGTAVTLDVLRDGQSVPIEMTTGDDGEGGSLLGIYVDPQFHLPIEVSVQIEEVGGPSAGMMFALGIIDLLTPEDETNGAVIAGTGTIDLTGEVGPIGGIAQKMAGAHADGATWFIAPRANCAAVTGHVPSGLEVVAVETLTEARAAVAAIGAGTTAALVGCD